MTDDLPNLPDADPGELHWLTRYDPDDGEPYGTSCYCDIGYDHDAAGNPTP